MTTPPITASGADSISPSTFTPREIRIHNRAIQRGFVSACRLSIPGPDYEGNLKMLRAMQQSVIREHEASKQTIPGSNTTPAPASGEGPYKIEDHNTRLVLAGPGVDPQNDWQPHYARKKLERQRDDMNRAYAAGFAAGTASTSTRDSGQGASQPTPSVGSGEKTSAWRATGRYCLNCGKMLSEHKDQKWCPSQPPPTPDLRAVVEECVEAMDVASSVGEIMFATCSLSMNAKRKLDAALTLARTALETKP